MLLLVIDTSGKDGFVALARALESGGLEVLEEVPLAGGTFSAQLIPQISGVLAKHGVRKTDLGAYVVVSGPGSFTGLRVGMAAIKALGEILRQPIVSVSLLEVIAVESGVASARAVSDAGRGEVYVGDYQISDGVAQLVREQLLPKGSFHSVTPGFVIVTADPALADISLQKGVRVKLVDTPRANAIGRLGWSKLRRGEAVAPEQLDANYIRRLDAEILANPSPDS